MVSVILGNSRAKIFAANVESECSNFIAKMTSMELDWSYGALSKQVDYYYEIGYL